MPKRRLEAGAISGELSTRFINLSPANVGREIVDALRRVCERLAIDMAVLWQWAAAAPDVIMPTHHYPASAGPATSGLDAETQLPWTLQQMLDGRMVVLAGLDEMPDEASVDRESGRCMGIRSNLTLPLSVGGRRRSGRWP